MGNVTEYLGSIYVPLITLEATNIWVEEMVRDMQLFANDASFGRGRISAFAAIEVGYESRNDL